MSPGRSDTLLRCAEMMADGTAVNWETEKLKTPELVAELQELETLDKIRAAGLALAATVSHEAPVSPLPPMSHRPLFTWGKLDVLEQIGEGTFGKVFRAYDPALQMEVALKLRKETESPDDPGEKLFLSEARRLARVRHPNVVIVHGVEVHGRRAGIWTEFLRGKTLETALRERGPWEAREAALVGVDLCRALAAVHAAGLIHRDVKTTNAMREQGGRVVLMDFGSGGDLPLTGDVGSTRHIHGTPITMAPEQLHGKVAGPATDVYGLGVLLYRLVTGAFPVEATTIPELVERHSKGTRKALRDLRPDLPTEFVEVVERSLETNPADRFQSAGEMELALVRTLHAAPSRGIGNPWLRAAAGIAVVAVGAFMIARSFDRPKEAPSPPDRGISRTLPTPPGPALAPLTATASLFRRTETGSDRLVPGSRIAPGDRLFMSLQGSDEMFVYVLNEDEEGNTFVLFPNPELTPANPLTPGTSHRLPDRRGTSQADWKVTSAGGKETITVIASRRPIPDVEREIDQLPKVQADRPVYPKVDVNAFRTLRGIGGVESGPDAGAGAPPPRVSEALKALAGQNRGADEPWIWQASLENPKTAR